MIPTEPAAHVGLEGGKKSKARQWMAVLSEITNNLLLLISPFLIWIKRTGTVINEVLKKPRQYVRGVGVGVGRGEETVTAVAEWER